MELQFQDAQISCLRTVLDRSHTQEVTQETRLSDGMPDIGTILGAWGTVLLRSKQWNADSVGISAGILAQVLYEPEEGGAPENVELWMPFQQRFDLPENGGKEGAICCRFSLLNIDARSTSARKLIIRGNVETSLQAKLQQLLPYFVPEALPDDVQILKNTYPVLLPKEAGERAFEMEESIPVPGEAKKIITGRVCPKVQEKKLLGDKVIFRGEIVVHLVYLGEDDQLYNCECSVPFSQYGELMQEYEPDGQVHICVVPTSMELNMEADGRVRLQLGLAAQYDICQRQMISLAEDAYSPCRETKLQTYQLELPGILDWQEEKRVAEQNLPLEGMRIADVSYMGTSLEKDMENTVLTGRFQVLYYDLEGNLRSAAVSWQQPFTEQTNNCKVEHQIQSGSAQGTVSASGATLQCDLMLCSAYTAQEAMVGISGMELEEVRPKEENRPSLILRRADKDDLWTIAKTAGSTVDTIMKANGLETEPEPGRMLLIPLC